MREKRDVHRVLVGKLEEKGPVGRCRHRWDANIKVGVQEVEWFAWTLLIWFRIRDIWRFPVNAVMKILIP
jgi:hypothetical protein